MHLDPNIMQYIDTLGPRSESNRKQATDIKRELENDSHMKQDLNQ